jgi:hypothetical protein
METLVLLTVAIVLLAMAVATLIGLRIIRGINASESRQNLRKSIIVFELLFLFIGFCLYWLARFGPTASRKLSLSTLQDLSFDVLLFEVFVFFACAAGPIILSSILVLFGRNYFRQIGKLK